MEARQSPALAAYAGPRAAGSATSEFLPHIVQAVGNSARISADEA